MAVQLISINGKPCDILQVWYIAFPLRLQVYVREKVIMTRIKFSKPARLTRTLLAAIAATALLALPVLATADTAMIETPLGDIEIELMTEDAPRTVANFLRYIDSGKYTNSFLHISEPGVKVQGGGFTFNGQNSFFIFTFDPIEDEYTIPNTRGTVAMAKASGAPDSATSQWFINLADNSNTHDNTVFGRVTGNGMAVVDAISQLTIIPFAKHPELPVIAYTMDDFNNGKFITEANMVMTAVSTDAVPPPPENFVMNAGLNDAWYNRITDGQGFFITVFPDLGAVNLAWFTYDTELPAEDATANLGSPGHRWLTALGTYQGDTAVLEIEIASGGLFDTAVEDIQRTPDGTIILSFSDCGSGLVEYDIPSINQQGSVPIERVADDNIALCEALIGE